MPIKARNGAQALAHNFGNQITPPIIPGGDLTNVQRQKNNDKVLKILDE
jgi:hypothetical protein